MQLFTVKGDFSLSADHTYAGIPYRGVAGETVAFPKACYLNADGEMHLAKGDADGTMPAICIALGAADDGEACDFLFFGLIRDETWTWTVGGEIYVSGATAGALTQTIPGSGLFVQPIAIALTAKILLLIPSLGYVKVP